MSLIPSSGKARWAIKVCVLTGCLMVSGALFASRFVIGVNPQSGLGCIDANLLLIDKADTTPKKGQIFAYRAMQAEPVYSNGTLMAKFLAAVPGDTVEVTRDYRILVNGQEFTRGLPLLIDVPVDELDRFIGRRTLQADEYWMLGDKPRSFDSRYWGPIHASQIVGRGYVIF